MYHPYLVSMLLTDLLSLHVITFLMFFSLTCHFFFVSSRCMFELKFAIYHRAAKRLQTCLVDVCSMG